MTEEARTSFPPPGPLEGPLVVVRAYTDDDAPALYEAVHESVDHLRPWMSWAEQHRSVDDSLEYIRATRVTLQLGTDFSMGIFRQGDGRYLGGAGLHVHEPRVPIFEIGYWIRQSAEGQGYVTEASRLLTRCAFESMGAARVMIACNARNERSRRVAERLGYVFEGRARNAERDTSGRLGDMLIFSMIPADYERVRGK